MIDCSSKVQGKRNNQAHYKNKNYWCKKYNYCKYYKNDAIFFQFCKPQDYFHRLLVTH